MTKEELKEKVGFITDEQTDKTICVYVTTGSTGLQLFNIVNDDLEDLKVMFGKAVKAVVVDREYELENYSTSLKRVDVMHIYDLADKRTEEMKRMAEATAIPVPDYFDRSATKIEKINGIYIVIKSNDNEHIVTLFKNVTNVDKAYAAASFFIFGKENQLFERQKENMLRITPSFQMMLVEDEIVLTDLDKLEKPLHLDAILQRETERDVEKISQNLITNNEPLKKVCQKPKMCQKLRHALTVSKVIKKLEDGSLTGAQIIGFVISKTKLKFHYNRGKTKFELKNAAEAERFIKLMDDDFLLSELTGEKYDSKDKEVL